MPTLAWNGKEISGWTCYGRKLKPKSGASLSNTLIFYVKDIKPKSGASFSNTWVIDGDKAKSKSGVCSSSTWDVGNAPILVIARAVALRLY